MYHPKKRFSRFIPTIALLLTISGLTAVGIFQVNRIIREECLKTLSEGTAIFANEIRQMFSDDHEQLQTISAMISAHDGDITEFAIQTMPYIPQDVSFSRYSIFLPDQTLLVFENGVYHSKKISFSYAEQLEKAPYVSDVLISKYDGQKVIFHTVPIIRDNKTVALLYGVTAVSKLPELFPSKLYNGQAKLLIVDGKNGELLMNSMDGELFNIYSEAHPPKYATSSGNSTQWFEKLLNGTPGSLSFRNEADGRNYYAYTKTTTINNWRAIVVAPEEAVFERAKKINEVFRLLLLLITLLIISYTTYFYLRMRKDMAIQASRIRLMGNIDKTTKLLNRNAYESRLLEWRRSEKRDQCVIYIDANGLRTLNNTIGHRAGDAMLRDIGLGIKEVFGEESAYRIGGDEFIIFVPEAQQEEIPAKTARLQELLAAKDHTVSIGMAFPKEDADLAQLISEAEKLMYEAKRQYYANQQDKQTMRKLNMKLEKMLQEKQDADHFLTLVAKDFMGAYVVDLDTDAIRVIYHPIYFQQALSQSKYRFQKAMSIYSDAFVAPVYQDAFMIFISYNRLISELDAGRTPALHYAKQDGSKVVLQIHKGKEYSKTNRETFWIFTKE